jgi:hypothetical protein
MAFTINCFEARIYEPSRHRTDESSTPRGYDRRTRPQTLTNRQSLTLASEAHDGTLCFDLTKLVEPTGAAAGANLAGSLPRLGTSQVRVPEGPGAALPRPGVVHGALSRLAVEEDAVVVVVQLLQALTDADLSNVLRLEFAFIEPDFGGERRDFLLVDPHKTGSTGAAIAAASALEAEAIFVPRRSFSSRHMTQSIFLTAKARRAQRKHDREELIYHALYAVLHPGHVEIENES